MSCFFPKRLAALAVLALLPSCVMDDQSLTETTPPSEAPATTYDHGFSRGRKDGSGGLSRDPGRHVGTYPAAEQADFLRGYEAGYTVGIKPGAPAPVVEEKPATGPVPQKVVNDCIDELQKQIPGKDIMLLRATRGENSYIVDLLVRGAEKPWRCYHDGTHCTGTEYRGEG